jgi:hypothetical protein
LVLPSVGKLAYDQLEQTSLDATRRKGEMDLIDISIAAGFPPLRQPKPEIADPGAIRLGSSNIAAGFPPLRQPKPEIADPGAIRLGSSNIAAGFPLRR